jgi:plastocyanin
MNQYQVVGLVVLIGLLLLALLTFWPTALTPSLDVASSTPDTVAERLASETKPSSQNYAGSGKRTFEKGVYVTEVYYTDQGFVPGILEVKRGEEVRFINRTSGVMHIIAEERTSSLYYRSLNQPNTVGKGGTYQIGMPEAGIMNYYNLNTNPRKAGQIIIK